MSDDFIYDDEEEGTGSSNRTFLVLAGILTLTLVLAALCSIVFLLSGRAGDRSDQIAAIETQNAVIAVTNAAVTQTIAAMETEAAIPSETPEPTSTNTPLPEPTNTPEPTDTPVVQQAEELLEEPEEEGEALAPEAEGTSVFGTIEEGADATPIAAVPARGAESETLPRTGLDVRSGVLAALALVLTLLVARRLRRQSA